MAIKLRLSGEENTASQEPVAPSSLQETQEKKNSSSK